MHILCTYYAFYARFMSSVIEEKRFSLSKRLEAVMRSRGITQEQVGAELGRDQSTVSRIRAGKWTRYNETIRSLDEFLSRLEDQEPSGFEESRVSGGTSHDSISDADMLGYVNSAAATQEGGRNWVAQVLLGIANAGKAREVQ